MKKTVLTLALLVVVMMAGAQTLNANFKKGDVKSYSTHCDFSIGMPMQGEQKGTSDTKVTYTVADATADGWTVEVKTDTFATTGSKDVITQFAGGSYYEALKKVPAKLKLGKNGGIEDITNADDVLLEVANQVVATINETYAKHPEMEKAVPKSTAMMKANEELTKDNLMDFFKVNSVFALNGKELKQNEPVDEKLFDMFNVKSTYTFTKNSDGSTTVAKKSTGNMTDEELKAFLKKQVEDMTGQQLDNATLEQTWNQLKQYGMTGLELSNDTQSKVDANGWLTSNVENGNIKVMGAQIKVNKTQKVD